MAKKPSIVRVVVGEVLDAVGDFFAVSPFAPLVVAAAMTMAVLICVTLITGKFPGN